MRIYIYHRVVLKYEILKYGAYGLEFKAEKSTEKFQIMENSASNTSASNSMDGESLGEESSFKYLGAMLSKDGTYNVHGSPQPQ